jgi:hypothetical protein
MPKGTPSRFAGLGRPEAATPINDAPSTTTTPVTSESPSKTAWRADRRAIPAYLTVRAWKQLRQLSVDTERSMSMLLIDGLDRLFQAHGLKTTADLDD